MGSGVNFGLMHEGALDLFQATIPQGANKRPAANDSGPEVVHFG
jgi:hypothetical protein